MHHGAPQHAIDCAIDKVAAPGLRRRHTPSQAGARALAAASPSAADLEAALTLGVDAE
jgi:hypothetical protein